MSNVWYENMQVYNRVQNLVLQFKQDTTKRMVGRLDELGLTYTYIKEQYEALTCEEFGQWLHSIDISRIKWVCKITDHLRKLSKPAKSTSNKYRPVPRGVRGGSYEPPILMIENFLFIVRLLMCKYELANVIHVLCVASI